MIEKIKALYAQVADKQEFCYELADLVGIKGASIFNHWFGNRYLHIPEKHQKIALKALEKRIKIQLRNQERALNIEVTTTPINK